MAEYAADIECTGFLEEMKLQENPKIHCLGLINIKDGTERVINGDDYTSITEFLSQGHTLYMHNCKLFDSEVLKWFGYDVSKTTFIDTLALSWYLFPNRQLHGLESFGVDFGILKPKVDDWNNLSQAEYNNRVIMDCRIQKALWLKQEKMLSKLYDGDYLRIVNFLMWKMEELLQQQNNQWKVDIAGCVKLELELSEAIDEKTQMLAASMPKVAVVVKRNRPAKPFLKSGELSTTGLRWKELTEANSLPFTHTEDIPEITGYTDPNPASHTQIKDWLYSLGWIPTDFKYVRENDEVRKIPQVNLKGGAISDSVKELIPIDSGVEHLEGLGILNHRHAMVKGFIRDNLDGCVTAKALGFTNTLRMQHKSLCNLPSSRVLYGKEIRGLLLARDGYALLGSDLSSLEERLKHHFQWKYDKEYVTSQMSEDYDPHIAIAMIAGLMNTDDEKFYKDCKKLEKEVFNKLPQQDKDRYKKLDEIRAAGKSTNYACLPTDNTQVLTPSGWIGGDKICAGDLVMGYDIQSGENKWTTVKSTYLYKDAEVIKVGHPNFQVESTKNHRWYGYDLKKVRGIGAYVHKIRETQEFNTSFNILNTAEYCGGISTVKPHQAALVGWLLSDGYYKWSDRSEKTSASFGKRKGLVASIAQASHKFQQEIRDLLDENGIRYKEDSLNSLNHNTITSFRMDSHDTRNFLDLVVGCRLNKHEVDWVKWVLNLSKDSLKAFVHSFWLADGNSKDTDKVSFMLFKQNVGRIYDALALSGYLLGYNVTTRGVGKCQTVRFQKVRKHTTCQRFVKKSERITDVFCLTTDLDSFVIRQGGIMTITGNCQYGSGVETIARTAKIRKALAKVLHKGYWDLNWSIRRIASNTIVKKTDFGDWQYNPISKFWYSLRSDKDRFSTLVQGSGAYIFDIWLYWANKLADKRGLEFRLLGQFHDEKILEVPIGLEDRYEKLVGDALAKVNSILKLNRELDCDIQFGNNYSEIH